MQVKLEHRGVPRLGPALLLCALLAAWIDLGSFHGYHSSDSLVPVLTSLYRWTPFFWGCNRIGMLVPLLAMPFQHPLTNLLVQCWLVLFAALATLVLLPRYLLRNAAWPAAAVLAAALFLVLLPRQTQINATFNQPHYVVALALGVGALLLVEATGRAHWLARGGAALVLVLLAGWVNSATPVFLGPLVLCRYLLARFPSRDDEVGPHEPGWRARLRCLGRWAWDGETVCALALLAAGAAGSAYFRTLVSCQDDPVQRGLDPLTLWPFAWRQLAGQTWNVIVPPRFEVHALAAPLLVGRMVYLLWQRSYRSLRAALALAAGGAVYGLFMGTLHWVACNNYCFKYWIPVIFYLLAGAAMILAPRRQLLPGRLGLRLALPSLAAGMLLLLATLDYGWPSLGRVRASLDHLRAGTAMPERIRDLLATRCTHVVGSYGEVWITVFCINQALYERGEHRTVWGVAGRCHCTWDLWGHHAPDDLRVAVLHEQGKDCHPEGAFFMGGFLPTLTPVERWPTLTLWRAPETCCAGAASSIAPPAPLRVSWHGGFYAREGIPESNHHWCDGRGKLTITNPSSRPRKVTVDMGLLTGISEPSRIHLYGPGLDETLTIDHDHGHIRRDLTVPAGGLTIVFDCEAPFLQDVEGSYHDERQLVFRVSNFKLFERPPLDEEMACAPRAGARYQP